MPHTQRGGQHELHVHIDSQCGGGLSRYYARSGSASQLRTSGHPWLIRGLHQTCSFSTSRKRLYPYPDQETSLPSDPEDILSLLPWNVWERRKNLSLLPYYRSKSVSWPAAALQMSLFKTVKTLCSSVWNDQTPGDCLPTRVCIQCPEWWAKAESLNKMRR